MKELTAYDIYKLTNEVEFLVGGKVDNIYQTEQKDLYLQIYIKDKPKQLLRILAGKCFYLTKTRPEFPENMQRFCSYLRKYLTNSRIKSIEQVEYERIIKIVLETKDSTYELYAELFGKGNIILVKDNKIISVAEEQIWADRKLKSGEMYIYPKREDTKLMFEKQKEKGSNITMNMLDEEFSKIIKTMKNSVKNKEIERIKTIINKQTENLNKALRESEVNKKKGELIYEHYQELKEITTLINSTKNPDEVTDKLKKYKLFKNLKNKQLVVDIK